MKKKPKPLSLLKSKYEIQDLISEEVISFTYNGQDHSTGKPILIWKYKHEYLSQELVHDLITQSEKIITLKHPNLMTMIDYHYDGLAFYTIYQSQNNPIPLEEWLKADKSKSMIARWKAVKEILQALLVIENRNLIHGGINLTNIYVNSQNQIKLAKIGLPLKIYQTNLKDLSAIEDALFYPPEFLQKGQYSIQSDIYSFGIIMYVLFSQKWPYKYSAKISDIKKEMIKDPLPFEKMSEKIPDQLSNIISICMSKDPEQRFPSFKVLVNMYQSKEVQFLAPKTEAKTTIQEEILEELRQSKKGKIKKSLVGVLGLAIAVLILTTGGIVYENYLTAIPDRIVPDIKGLTLEEAETILSQAQLAYTIAGERIHPIVEKGAVLESKPPAGRKVKQNRTIRLFLSKGVSEVLVPDLTGRNVDQAIAFVERDKITVSVEDELFSVLHQKGIILSQSPSPNTVMLASENIKVVISKGFPIKIAAKDKAPGFF